MMFLRRRYDKEIMDDFSITDDRLTAALDELRTINTWLGGSGTSRAGIRKLLAPGSFRANMHPITVLDIGSGGSENFSVSSPHGSALEVISVDINTGVCRYLKEHDPARHVVCADAIALPFKPDSVDIVHASLFLHHFTEDEIVCLLTAFLGIARRGVVINDLHRSVLALGGITLLTRLFSNCGMVKNDAPLSVKRGFLRNDIRTVLDRIPCSAATVKWRWAFRWLVVMKKQRPSPKEF
jgi:hypothetical protein